MSRKDELYDEIIDRVTELIELQKKDGSVLFLDEYLDNNHVLIIANHSDDEFLSDCFGETFFDCIEVYKQNNPHLRVVK